MRTCGMCGVELYEDNTSDEFEGLCDDCVDNNQPDDDFDEDYASLKF